MFGKTSSFLLLHGAKILVDFEYAVSAMQLLKTVVELKPKQRVESNTRFFLSYDIIKALSNFVCFSKTMCGF